MYVYLMTCAVLFSAFTDVEGKYQYQPEINGWITKYMVARSWDEALGRCQRDGAILASPITEALRQAMIKFVGETNTEHFIGINSKLHQNIFVSLEGVLLEDAPVLDMVVGPIDPAADKRCMVMNRERISVQSCTTPMPFMCYKKYDESTNITECGTDDKDYQLLNSTGNCYKFYKTVMYWPEAYETCITDGGYLAIINDENEAKAIAEFITDESTYVLVGLKDWQGNGTWASLHGHPMELIFHDWESSSKPKTSKCCDCGTIHPRSGNMKNFNCDQHLFKFVCEMEPDYGKFLLQE